MTKKEFDEILGIYKDQLNLFKEQVLQLREEKAILQDQNFRLQDGLLSIRAPDAYREAVIDRQPPFEVDEEQKAHQTQVREIQDTYLREMEKPLFSTAEDMLMHLGGALSDGAMKTQSLRGNEES